VERPDPSLSITESCELLAASALFGHFPEEQRTSIAKRIKWKFIPGRSILFHKGERGDSMYLMASGRLALQADIERNITYEVARGDNFGELALVTDTPRTATAVALRDSVVGELEREDFMWLITKEPQVGWGMLRILADWLVKPRVITDASPRITAWILFGQESTLGPVHRSIADVAERIGADVITAENCNLGSLAGRIEEAERKGSRIVLVGANDNEEWTTAITRQADRIHVVPPISHEAGALKDLERWKGIATDLVVVHPPETINPKGTSRWTEAIGKVRIHHVRQQHQDDLSRLARHISGKAIGLVLGGGGARGLAHIGVIKALHEHKIPIDIIGGSSIGAVMAGLYAQGRSWQEMYELSRKVWIGLAPTRSFTLPVHAVWRNGPIAKSVQMTYNGATFEDGWIQSFATTSNLNTQSIQDHDSGSLERWVKASIAFPGCAPPVPSEEGDVLVDGGVLDNLPWSSMRSRTSGPIIVVDVSSRWPHRVSADAPPPSGWRSLFRNLMFKAPTKGHLFPYLGEVVLASAVLASSKASKEAVAAADVAIRPNVQDIGLFSWKEIDHIVDLGYKATIELLDENNSSPSSVRLRSLVKAT